MEDRLAYLKSYVLWAKVERYYKSRGETEIYNHVLDVKQWYITELGLKEEVHACPLCSLYYDEESIGIDCFNCSMYGKWPNANNDGVKTNCFTLHSAYEVIEHRILTADKAGILAGNLANVFWNEYKARELK